jgi:hypothetical protein
MRYYQGVHRTHFLTFGAGHERYDHTVQRISDEARSSNFFATLSPHNRESVENLYPEFFSQHGDFIEQNKKGYGLWIWKSFLISKKLDELPDDEILVYLDAGCTINYSTQAAIDRWNYYLERAFQQNLLAFNWEGESFWERKWTRKDLVEHLQLSDSDLLTGQIEAGVNFWRVNEFTRNFAKRWFALSTQNNYQFLCEPEPSNRLEGFQQHRFDQAVFSALCKSHGITTLPNRYFEFAPNWAINATGEPIWTTRNRPKTT